jgi:hypothetical protein
MHAVRTVGERRQKDIALSSDVERIELAIGRRDG